MIPAYVVIAALLAFALGLTGAIENNAASPAGAPLLRTRFAWSAAVLGVIGVLHTVPIPAPVRQWAWPLLGICLLAFGLFTIFRFITHLDKQHVHGEYPAYLSPFLPPALAAVLLAASVQSALSALTVAAAFSVGMILGSTFRTSVPLQRMRRNTSSLVGPALLALAGFAVSFATLTTSKWTSQSVSRTNLVPFVTVILLGLFLGMRHSTDSDHVVAVSTLVSRQGSLRASLSIGLLWGLGHTVTIFLVGSAIILFGVVIPRRLGLSMEFTVALMLILLGILNLTGVLRRITERLSPTEPDQGSEMPDSDSRLGWFHTVRPLFVGLVHGLAGSAAVALLVLSTIRSPYWASAYLVVFGIGTMLGMTLMTTAISMPLIYAQGRFARITSHMTVISGIVSVAFGIFLAIQIGFVDGLFTSQPHWTAH